MRLMNHLLKVSEAICTFRIVSLLILELNLLYFFSCEQTKNYVRYKYVRKRRTKLNYNEN